MDSKAKLLSGKTTREVVYSHTPGASKQNKIEGGKLSHKLEEMDSKHHKEMVKLAKQRLNLKYELTNNELNPSQTVNSELLQRRRATVAGDQLLQRTEVERLRGMADQPSHEIGGKASLLSDGIADVARMKIQAHEMKSLTNKHTKEKKNKNPIVFSGLSFHLADKKEQPPHSPTTQKKSNTTKRFESPTISTAMRQKFLHTASHRIGNDWNSNRLPKLPHEKSNQVKSLHVKGMQQAKSIEHLPKDSGHRIIPRPRSVSPIIGGRKISNEDRKSPKTNNLLSVPRGRTERSRSLADISQVIRKPYQL